MIIGAAPPLARQIAAYRLALVEISMAGRLLTIATPPFDHTGSCRTERRNFQAGDLETAVEWYRVLADGWFSSTTKPAELRSFYPGADKGDIAVCLEFLNNSAPHGLAVHAE